jgi:Trypsin-like peptidase domain/Effector-associated domain 1
VSTPLSARVVEVIADLGDGARPRYRYGSGCIVRSRVVLTAAHVVVAARAVQVRTPDKKLLPALADSRFVGREPGPDLALLEIDDDRIDLAAIELAVVDRDSPTATPVQECHAVGYPWFAERPSPSAVRDTVDAYGYVPVLSKLAGGLLAVQVTASPRPLPPERTALGESEWSGMSGAPVVAEGCLLGVVSEHAAREGSSAITAVPLSALEADPAHPNWGPGVANAREWWARLGAPGLGGLRRLPAPEAARGRERAAGDVNDGNGAAGPRPDGAAGAVGDLILVGSERREFLAALCDAFYTKSRIDGVLDDLGLPRGRRPGQDMTIEDTWREVFHELDSGRLENGYHALLEIVLERFGFNQTFVQIAERHGITRRP